MGGTMPNVRVMSSVGASTPLPIAVTVQLVLARVVVPVRVAAVEVRQIAVPPTGFRHRIVRPLGIVDFIEATTLPGPSVEKANVRAAPLFVPVWALSFIEV